MARLLLLVMAAIVIVQLAPANLGFLGEYKDYLLALLLVLLLKPLLVGRSN